MQMGSSIGAMEIKVWRYSYIMSTYDLKPNDKYHNNGREYRLLLPCFSTVTSLEIGVSQEVDFSFLRVRP